MSIDLSDITSVITQIYYWNQPSIFCDFILKSNLLKTGNSIKNLVIASNFSMGTTCISLHLPGILLIYSLWKRFSVKDVFKVDITKRKRAWKVYCCKSKNFFRWVSQSLAKSLCYVKPFVLVNCSGGLIWLIDWRRSCYHLSSYLRN